MRGSGNSYRRFLTATTVSAVGDGLLVTGLPLLARQATSSAFLVSAVFAAGRVPWTAALLFGSFADRRDARKVMILADLGRAGLLAALGLVLVLTDRNVPIVPIIVLAGLLAVGQIVFFAASQRAVPVLVPSEGLEQANSSFATLTTAGEQFVGPQLGAVFLTGGVIPVFGDAVSFAGSAALLRGLPPIPPIQVTTTLRRDVIQGWRFFRNSRIVLFISALMTLVTCISAGALATEVILVQDTLGKSKWWFGVFTAVLAVGAMLGSWAAPRVIKFLGVSSSTMAILMTGLAYLMVAGQRSVIAVFAAMFLQQAATMVAVVATVSIRQRVIPDHLRGRVISLSRSFAYGSQVLGGLGGGWIAERHGTDPLFIIIGVATVLVSLATARPLQRLLRANAAVIPR
jgi:MFS family permease